MKRVAQSMRTKLIALFAILPLCGAAQVLTPQPYPSSEKITTDTILSDSKIIQEVQIGDQIWMNTNLDVDTFQNGDKILQAQSLNEWMEANKKKQPAWCYFDNDSINGATYGKLYNFYAVEDPRGLAPSGWRIPSYSDWKTLTTTVGGKRTAGLALKNVDGWKHDGNGVNSSEFSALPSGCRSTAMVNTNHGFCISGNFGYWWSSSYDERTDSIWILSLTARRRTYFMLYDTSKSDGYAVRCIKN